MSLAKAKALVELAAHPNTTAHEAAAAALRACRMIREENLLSERGPGMRGGGDETFTITTHLRIMTEDTSNYFVQRARPWTEPQMAQRTLLIPKCAIVEMVGMTPSQKRKFRYHDAVIEKLVVRMAWFERATEGWRF